MSEGENALKYWTTGFGNMQKKFSDHPSAERRPARRALKTDWNVIAMPADHTKIVLGIPITEEELATLSMGHVPKAMEDHWFTYFDGEALNLHRSWTGFCIYRVHVRHSLERDGYVLTHVTVNRDPSQYGVTNDAYDKIVATALVGEALGKDMSNLWDEAFRIDVVAHQDGTAPQPPIGFWLPDKRLGCLSNWHDAGFEFCGITFKTAEHWIMWQKAKVMRDEASAKAILAANTPSGAKALGKKVAPFDGPLWDAVCEELAYVGIREKFLQNPEVARELLATGSATLAEASPKDHIWGIGIADDNPGFADFTAWNGTNLQGRICMRVRQDLRLALQIAPRRPEYMGTSKEDLEQVLQSHLGGTSLVSLARSPTTRTIALCYAHIAQRHAHYPNPRAFLMKAGQATLAKIAEMIELDNINTYTPVGWNELLAQLAFLRRIGTL